MIRWPRYSEILVWRHVVRRAALQPGERVLILGAGIVGLLAVQVAKFLGAGYIAIVDRDPTALVIAQQYGADSVVSLTNDIAPTEALQADPTQEPIDVVMDYLWGAPAQAALAHRRGRPGRRSGPSPGST